MELLQTDFRDSVLVEEATWQAIIIIPKGGGEYHGIGIVGVACKAVEVILNIRFTTSITYHNSLHGFRAGRGTGNTTLEVKILQQVTAMREVVLHVIFLDLHKLYNALDKSRCLEILEGYGVGPRVLRLLRRYWAQLQMVARAGGYYGVPFCRERGVTQGEPLLPTILNVVVDTVVRYWESLLAGATGGQQRGLRVRADDGGIEDPGKGQREKAGRRGTFTVDSTSRVFNVGDGVLASTDTVWPHTAFDTLMGIFDQVGLRKNVRKTVGMV